MSKTTDILIVDDHQMVLDGIKSMLHEHPQFNVVGEAISAEIAMSKVKSNPTGYDMVLTDITMPKISGIELCRYLKTHYPQIKVMMISMHDDVEHVKNAIAAEADGYMLKSTTQKEFIFGLNQLMENGSYFSQQILPLILKQIHQPKPMTKHKLSQREMEVLDLITKELTSKEIAEKLFISKLTVDTHRLNLMEKTGSKSVVGLIKYAIQNQLVEV